MNEKVYCKKCKTDFEVSDSQQEFITKSRQKNMTFIVLNCTVCKAHNTFNPNEGVIKQEEQGTIWRTPISGITGYVCFVDDEEASFYGCGESGFMWWTKEKLFQSIEEIIEKYPHRKNCYLKKEGEWFPNEKEPENMDDLIENEDDNNLTDFVID